MQFQAIASYEQEAANHSEHSVKLATFVLINLLNCSKMTDLGKRIMACRKKKNLSQTDLAHQVGVSY